MYVDMCSSSQPRPSLELRRVQVPSSAWRAACCCALALQAHALDFGLECATTAHADVLLGWRTPLEAWAPVRRASGRFSTRQWRREHYRAPALARSVVAPYVLDGKVFESLRVTASEGRSSIGASTWQKCGSLAILISPTRRTGPVVKPELEGKM